MKMSRGVFKVMMDGGETCEVKGYKSALFAIDKPAGRNYYVVTHLPTGKALFSFNKLSKAKRFIEAILGSPPVSWQEKNLKDNRNFAFNAMCSINLNQKR